MSCRFWRYLRSRQYLPAPRHIKIVRATALFSREGYREPAAGYSGSAIFSDAHVWTVPGREQLNTAKKTLMTHAGSGKAKMKVCLQIFMPTADDLTTVQTYGHEHGEAIFL